jgi:hypothetical protein
MNKFLIAIFLLPQKAFLLGIIYPLKGINLLLTHPIKLFTKGKDDALEAYSCDIKEGKIYTTTIAWLTLMPLVSAIIFPITTLHNIIAWKKDITVSCAKHNTSAALHNLSSAMTFVTCDYDYYQKVGSNSSAQVNTSANIEEEIYDVYEPTLANGFRMLFGREPKYKEAIMLL